MKRAILLIVLFYYCTIAVVSQTRNCWTCSPGYVHWYDIPGMAEPADKCACVPVSSTPTERNCWTCPAGYVHWYDVPGLAEPTDKCACVKASTTATTTSKAPTQKQATAAPTQKYDCWTCSPGWVHWYDIPGMAQPADKCACVKAPTTTETTRAPTSAPTTTTTTKSPTTTTTTKAPAYDCWTCSPGWVHWYEIPGMAQPADKCACVKAPTSTETTKAPTSAPTTTTTRSPTTTTTTTKAPSPTYDCWTCSPGYVHWYDIPGMAQPADKCACVLASSSPTTTSTKSPTTTSTKAPSTTSTKTPTSTPYCWTCPAGWYHWWEYGYASPPTGDQCQCIQGAPPNVPVTAAPTNSPPAVPSNSLQKFVSLLTPNNVSPGGVAFSPYVAPYSPWNGPALSLIDQLGSILMKQTNYRTVLIYYTEPYLVGSLVKNGFNIFGIISLGSDWNNNANLIQKAIDTYRKYPNNVVALVCGNELGMQLGVTSNTAAIINNCLTTVKKAGLGIPVGVMDTYTSWTQNSNIPWTAVAQNADFIGANIYAWWDNVYIPPPFICETEVNGPQITYNNFMKVQNLYPSIPVILSEFGWPSCGTGYTCTSRNVVDGSTCARANDANQKKFVQGVIDIFRKNQRPCNTFAAFREAWKGTNDADINEYWGVCQGSYPYSCVSAPV